MTDTTTARISQTLDLIGALARAWDDHDGLISPIYATPIFNEGEETIGSDGHNIAAVLRTTRPLYVDDDMVGLWMHVAQTFSDELPLVTAELFEPDGGFAYLEKPAVAINESGVMFVQALQWHSLPYRGRPCILIIPYYAETPFDMLRFYEEREGSLYPGDNVRPDGPPRWPAPLPTPGAFTIAPLNEQTKTSETLDWTRSLWALCHQRIAVATTHLVDRATRRRAQRARFAGPPTVQVIRLRHATLHSADHEGMSHVDWTHRWIVGGHWRNQWLPSEDRHAPRWIAPHIKGPSDKPLVTTRAYELIR